MSTLKANSYQHVDRASPSIIINSDGSVSISSTVTYEDVTSVDAVGVITGRSNADLQNRVNVGSGVSIKAGGLNVTAGISTVQALQATTGTFSGAVSGTTGTFSAAVSGTTGTFTNGLNITGDISNGLNVTGLVTTTQLKISTGANAFETSANVFKGTSGQKGVYLRSALSAEGTPSYSSVDDTNTGIFLPGSDVFGVTTGGYERFRITSAGKVGIGTIGTTARLAIKKGSEPGFDLIPADDTDDFQINFNRVDGTNRGFITYEFDNDALKFRTGGSGEALRITSAGKVGIGSDNPGQQLHVNKDTGTSAILVTSPTAPQIRFNPEAGDGTDGDRSILGQSTGSSQFTTGSAAGDTILRGTSTGNLIFGTGTSERARINSSGDILLNKGVQNTILSNTSDASDSQSVFVGGGGGASDTRGAYIWAKGNEYTTTGGYLQLNAGNVGTAPITFSTGGAEVSRIDSSGRLLLGTTTEGHSNANNLTIATTGNTGITLRSGTSNNGNIFFSDATSGGAEYEGMIWYAHGDNSMRFAIAQTERLCINSSGNAKFVGIVTATNFVPTTIQTGHRNLVINGDMSVAQRMHCKGVTSTADAGFCSIDRYFTHYSGGSGTTQWLTFTPGDERSGSKHYLRFNPTTASDYTCIRYPIEDVRTIAGSESITVSFDAKYVTNQPNGGLACWFQQAYGESGSTGTSTSVKTITLTTSWVRYSLTFNDFASMSGKTIGAGSFVEFLFGQGGNATSTAWTIDVTNLQIERGTEATPFEFQPVADTVARCERYCYGQKYIDQRDSHNNTNNECLVTLGVSYTSTRVLAHLYWPTTMRARPFATFKDQACFQVLTSDGSWTTCTSCSMRIDQSGGRLDITHGGSLTAGGAAEIRFTGSGDYYYVNAEMPIEPGNAHGGVYT